MLTAEHDGDELAVVDIKEVSDPLNDAGSGIIVLHNDDPKVDEISEGDIISIYSDGEWWVDLRADLEQRVEVSQDGAAYELTTWTCRGILAEFDDSTVGRGWNATPWSDRRIGNFAWPWLDDSGWDSATQRSVVGDVDEFPPLGLAGIPYHCPLPLAKWISCRTTTAGNSDPVGSFPARYSFTTATTKELVIYISADDCFRLWFDGQPMGEVWREGELSGVHVYAVHLVGVPADDHVIGVDCVSWDRTGVDNAAMFWAAVFEVDRSSGEYEETILFSTADSGWKTKNFPDPYPGPTVGQYLDRLWVEAKARGDLDGWTRDWDEDEDSNGEAWTEYPDMFADVGTSFLATQKEFAAAGLIEISAGPGREHHMFDVPSGGRGNPDNSFEFLKPDPDDKGVGNLRQLEWQKDDSTTISQVHYRWADGWARTGTAGRAVAATYPEVATQGAAADLAGQLLSQMNAPTESILVGAVPGQVVPVDDVSTGDYIDVPGPSGVENQRIVNVAASLEDGLTATRVELISRRVAAITQQRARQARIDAGSAGGRAGLSSPVTARQSGLERLDPLSWNFSAVETVEDFKSGSEKLQRSGRFSKIVITQDIGTAGTTTVDIYRNFTKIKTVSIDYDEAELADSVYDTFTAGDHLWVKPTAVSDSQNVNIRVYGSPYGGEGL